MMMPLNFRFAVCKPKAGQLFSECDRGGIRRVLQREAVSIHELRQLSLPLLTFIFNQCFRIHVK